VSTTPAFSSKLVWLTIKGKGGVRIADISQFQSENEVLFGTRAKFRVAKAEQNGNRYEVALKEI
jgi:hypothetical protein